MNSIVYGKEFNILTEPISAEKGNVEYMRKLTQAYIDMFHDACNENKICFSKRDCIEQAFYWAKRGAELGDAESQCLLGDVYFLMSESNIRGDMGRNNEIFADSSIYWYQKALQQGYKKALFYIGIAYSDLIYDCDSAYYYYYKAANEGISYAKFYIAFMYSRRCIDIELLDGKGYELEYREREIFWCEQCANDSICGCIDALVDLYEDKGQFYTGFGSHNENPTYNEEKFIYWLKKGAELGCPNCQLILARQYEENGVFLKNPKQSFYWKKKCAEEQEDLDCYYSTALSYIDGDGVSTDLSQAAYWLMKIYNFDYTKNNNCVHKKYWHGKVKELWDRYSLWEYYNK